jgi:peroxiredoxin
MKPQGCSITWLVALSVGLSGLASAARAQPAATQPSAADVAAPTTNPSASVTPGARKLLEQISHAYAGLKSLSISGKIKSNFDIDGQRDAHESDFTAIYDAGGKFRHEIKGDAILGNTGQKVYAFITADNAYITHDAPVVLTLDSLDTQIARVLRKQNPSLALALSGDAEKELLDGAQSVEDIGDVNVDAGSWPAIRIVGKDRDVTIALDAKTHLVRWTAVDVAKTVRQQGAHDVKSAMLTYDYANTSAAPVDAAQFAWSPPPGAQEIQQDAAGGSDLEGKAAPAFALTGLDGKQVSSADLKGSVYVLDFWATWCGPCVAALPHLDETYKSLKGSGLKVYACDQQEDKDTVQKFVTDTKLSIPVLLDSDGKVGQAYGVQGIPQTVVIGKDGKIRKVFVGTGPGSDDAIRAAVNKALAES